MFDIDTYRVYIVSMIKNENKENRMDEIKQGFERALLVNRASDNVTNTKWVDSDGFMVGIKKGGNKVTVETFTADMEKKGLAVMWSDNLRKA